MMMPRRGRQRDGDKKVERQTDRQLKRGKKIQIETKKEFKEKEKHFLNR